MAQGKHKAPKVQVPGKKKPKRQKISIKKGRVQIAPKKKNLLEADRLKKGLEKTIRARIEEEVTQKTTSYEPRSLRMMSSSSKSKN